MRNIRRGQNYRAKRTRAADGNVLDSRAEAMRYAALSLMDRVGLIRGLVCHPEKITLIPRSGNAAAVTYRPDFAYTNTDTGQAVYEDCKPRPMSAREKLLFRLWEHFGPAPLWITAKVGKRGWRVTHVFTRAALGAPAPRPPSVPAVFAPRPRGVRAPPGKRPLQE